MNVDPRSVLLLAGVSIGQIYPTAVDCPLCNAKGKLEVRAWNNVSCKACCFAGDVIELLAEFRKEPVPNVTHDLIKSGVINMAAAETEKYFSKIFRQQKIRKFIKQQSERFICSSPGSIQALLEDMGCRHHIQVIKSLAPHAFPCFKEDIEESEMLLPKGVKQVLRLWGKYAAIGIPAWDGAEVVGLYIVTRQHELFLPLTDEQFVGNAFAQAASIADQATIIVQSAKDAMKLALWSIDSTGRIYPFVVPFSGKDNAWTYCGGRAIYWSPENSTQWIMRAMGTPKALTVISKAMLLGKFDRGVEYPCGGSFNLFYKSLIRDAIQAHDAVARHLIEMTETEARANLTGTIIDASDKERILGFAGQSDREHIGRLFSENIELRTITWNGETIMETEEGWKTDKGKIISTATIHMERIEAGDTSGDAFIDGYVTIHRKGEKKSYRFRSSLSEMREDTKKWLESFVLRCNAGLVYVDRAWGSKLLEVSQQFHIPEAVLSDHKYGWIDHKLRMPNFVVDVGGITSSPSGLTGPILPTPAPMVPAEWDAFKNMGYCRLFLALLGNMVRTMHGVPGLGIMLSNEPHVVVRTAAVFGSSVVTDPSKHTLETGALAPLPIFTSWTDPGLAGLLSGDAGHNVMISVPERISNLCRIKHNWLRLKISDSIDYQALRSVFQFVPMMIRDQVMPDTDDFYRQLADRVNREVKENCVGSKLATSAMDLDYHTACSKATAATRIMELIFSGVKEGKIDPVVTDSTATVRVAEMRKYVSDPVVRINSTDLGRKLLDAQYLIEDSREKWVFSRLAWDLHQSVAMTAL